MNISAKSSSSRCALIGAALCVIAAGAWAGDWSEPKPSLYHGQIATTHRAKLAGDWLIIEAKHNPGWHTYAMDNVERAQKATGKETPETELPTRITVTGGLKIVGGWKQTAPKDLTKLDIQWYSWGFDDVARFAVRVERTGGTDATITVNGQACNETSCSMVRDLKLTVSTAPDASPDADADKLIATLVDVQSKVG